MREDIIGFIEDGEGPFSIQMMGTSYCDGSYLIRRPQSPIYCFEYILEGKGVVQQDSKIFYPCQGDIYILHRGANHFYFSDRDEPWTKVWFNTRGPLVDALMALYGLQDLNHIEGLDLSHLFNRMLDCGGKGQSQKETFNSACLVFHEILQNIHDYVKPRQVDDLGSRIKDLMDKNAEYNVSLEYIAKEAFCSPAHAIRVFKERYGITPYEYMMNRRVALAKQLLKNTSLSIKEVAHRLSFCDVHYFSTFFKRHTGLSPSAFRKG